MEITGSMRIRSTDISACKLTLCSVIVMLWLMLACGKQYHASDNIYDGFTPVTAPYTDEQRRAIVTAMPKFLEMALDTSKCNVVLLEDSTRFLVEYVPLIPSDTSNSWDSGGFVLVHVRKGAIVVIRKVDLQIAKVYITQ